MATAQLISVLVCTLTAGFVALQHIHRQRLLGRVRRRARRNHYTPAPPLPPHIARRQLDHVQHPAIIDLDDVVLGLEQLAGFIESIFKVVLLLGHARISNGDVDAAGLLEGGFQILPACCVAFDEGGAWRGAFFRQRVEVEDECFGAFGGENLDGRKADARGASADPVRSHGEIWTVTRHERNFSRQGRDVLFFDLKGGHPLKFLVLAEEQGRRVSSLLHGWMCAALK